MGKDDHPTFVLFNFLPSTKPTWRPCKLHVEATQQPFNNPQFVRTSVGCRQLLRLGRRLLSSKDVRLQQRHLVVERRNFQPSRRFDAKRSTLCQQGSYCILLRFRRASTKITWSIILLHEVQRVGISVQN